MINTASLTEAANKPGMIIGKPIKVEEMMEKLIIIYSQADGHSDGAETESRLPRQSQ